MKNIAIFSNDLSVGGIQKSLYNLLRNVDYTKFNIDVYLLKDNNFYQDEIPSKVNVYYLKKHSKLLKLLPFFLVKKICVYEGLDKEYDVAIDFDSYQELTAVNTLKCRAKKKIMWIHSDWEQRLKYDVKFKIAHFFSKSKNKCFDEYVGVSEGVISPFLRVNNLDAIKHTIIPNIIDTNEIFQKADEGCDLEICEESYNLCSVGSVLYIKGFDIVVDDMRKIIDYNNKVHLYIIGDGNYMAEIKKQIKMLNLGEHITLLGFKNNPYKYMNLMDGFILESRFEGQGMVFLEAKALGLDIFMPKNLEKYNSEIRGCDNIVKSIQNAQKKKKVRNTLGAYNEEIIAKIEILFSKKIN